MKLLGEEHTDADVEELMDCADVDGDGKISFDGTYYNVKTLSY